MKNVHGISLLELTIAIVIVVILVSIAIPRTTLLNKVLAKAEIEKMHAFFRYVQQKAIVHQKKETIVFNSTNGTYTNGPKTERLCGDLRFGVPAHTYGPPGNAKQLVIKPITFAGERITLYPSGTISPGTVYLTDKNRSLLYAITCPLAGYSCLHQYFFDHGWKQIS